MNKRFLASSILALAILALTSAGFAEQKVGVVFEGDEAIQTAITESLTEAGHEIVDIVEAAKDKKLDSIAAAAIGKDTGAEIIVSGKKAGPVIILKILSAKNDTVVGGTAKDAEAVVDQVKKLIAENLEKMIQ